MPPLVSIVEESPAPGLASATGDYVWFREPDSRPSTGALTVIEERLREHSPDVLLLESGRLPRRRLARIAHDGVTTLEERPGLASAAAGGLRDKVFRRQFLLDLGVAFGHGTRAELPVTWAAFLAAKRIAAAPGARCDGPPAPAASEDDLRSAYDAVFAFAGPRPEILPAMVQRELAVLKRLPHDQRRAHFAAISATLRRHGGGGAPLVARNAYDAYRALEAARAARRKVRRAPETLREQRSSVHYRRRRRAPIDENLAVFAAYWYRGYSCNPRAIYEKARELVPDMRGVWVVKDPEAVPAGVEHVVAGTREYYDVLARGRVFVNNVNFPNDMVKRDGTVHVMTHHGTPLKKMGLDQRETPAGATMNYDALMYRCARWDFSVTANHFTTLAWEHAYPGDHETLETGYPRNDVLANADEAAVRDARAELGIADGQVAVLYLPTHREFRSSYVPVLDVAKVADALGPECVLLVRTHYFYGADPQIAALHRAGRIRDVAAHPSIEQLYLAADGLVTDYSSAMFDYAVLDRPIVIHAPDWESYRALRGTYFDLMAEHPGMFCRTEDEVADAFTSGAAYGKHAARARAEFRARFCSLEDGHAAERVVRRVWLGEREVSAARPAAVAG